MDDLQLIQNTWFKSPNKTFQLIPQNQENLPGEPQHDLQEFEYKTRHQFKLLNTTRMKDWRSSKASKNPQHFQATYSKFWIQKHTGTSKRRKKSAAKESCNLDLAAWESSENLHPRPPLTPALPPPLSTKNLITSTCYHSHAPVKEKTKIIAGNPLKSLLPPSPSLPSFFPPSLLPSLPLNSKSKKIRRD